MLFFYTTSILNNFLTSWIIRFNYPFRVNPKDKNYM